jgi:hypothetical protein
MIAAYAAMGPRGEGQVRLYVIRLTGARHQARAVPSAVAVVSAGTAWTAKGSWLLYQGPGGHLWAYQVASGSVRAFRTPCCQNRIVALAASPG